MRGALLLASALCLAQDPFATQACVGAAGVAMKAGRPEEARRLLLEGLSQDPRNSRLLARLHRMDRAAGRAVEAEGWARRLLDLGLDPGDPSLPPALLARSEALRRSEGHADVVAVVGGGGRLIEGIAVDPGGGLLLAEVNARRVLRRSARGRVTPFATLRDWAPIALAVDARRGRLWVAGGTVEEMEGFDGAAPRRGVLAAFDLRSGRCVREVSLDGTAAHPRVLGDLLLAKDGTVFASDGAGGGVWRLGPASTRLEPFVPEGRLASPQGMAWLRDGAILLADYALGLFRVEPSGALHPLATPDGACLLGLDGLIAWKGGYCASQNGVAPSRLWRLDLRGDRVEARCLLRAHPAFGDPTLMTATPEGLLLVANAQWERFGAGGAPKEAVDPVVLLRLR